MTIYLDIIFLENLILNYIILIAVSIITKTKIKYIKTFMASLIGSVYAIFYYLFRMNLIFEFFMKILLSVIMVYVSYWPKNLKECLKKIIIFYLTSFVFGGGAIAIIYMVNSGRISIQNGIIIGSYSINTILIGISIAFIIIVISFKLVKAKISKKDLFCDIKIKINKKMIRTTAMIDTGNMLKEPITNIPVIVVEKDILNKAIPEVILKNIECILGGDFTEISNEIEKEYISKLKVIPYKSLGKENGILLGIKADEVSFMEENEEIKLTKVIIGIYNKKLSKNGKYHALIGINSLSFL